MVSRRLRALEPVREGRLYDLGCVLDERAPVFPGRYFRQTLVRNPGEPLGDNRVDWTWEVFTATTQLGTHLHTLAHLREDDRGYGGLTAAELAESISEGGCFGSTGTGCPGRASS